MATRWPEPSFEGLETTSPVELANNFEDYYKDVFMYTLKNPTAAAPARYVMDIMFQANKIMALMKSEIAAPAPGSGYVAASVNPNPNPQPEELKREEVDVDVLPMADPFAEAYNAPPAPPIPDPAARFEQMMANLDQSTRQFHVDDREDGHDGNHGNDRDGVEDGAAEYFRPGDFMDNAMDSEDDSDWDNESETDSEFYEYSEGSDAESEEETDSDSEQYEYTEGSAVDTEEECEAPEPEHPQSEHPKPEQLEEPHEADDEKEPDEGEHRPPGTELAQCLRLDPRDSGASPESNADNRHGEPAPIDAPMGQDPVGLLSVPVPELEKPGVHAPRHDNND